MSDYSQLLNDFYELKKKYDKNNEKMKKKIRNNDDLSREQKREKIRSLRPKCVKCEKPVGTIFEIKRDSLRAICGANNPQMASDGYKPCSLNINIKKPVIINLEVAIKDTRNKRNQLLEKINLNKVRLLYVSREKQVELVEKIEQMKVEYRKQSELLEDYITKHLDVSVNEEDAKNKLLKVHGIAEEIVGLIREKKTKEAVEMYIDSYMPAVSDEMASKYRHVYIETDGKDMHYLKEISSDNSFVVLEVNEEGLSNKSKNNSSNNNSIGANDSNIDNNLSIKPQFLI